MIKIKRAYDPVSSADGKRILVDRLWPRGLKKETLKIDKWEKEIAPSNELRKWFDHDPAKWTEFKRKYKSELKSHKTKLQEIKSMARNLTLVYGAKDTVHNQAVVLQKVLEAL